MSPVNMRLPKLRPLPGLEIAPSSQERADVTEPLSTENVEIVEVSSDRRLATREMETAWFAHADVVCNEPVEDAPTPLGETTHSDLVARAVLLSEDDFRQFSLDISPPAATPPPPPIATLTAERTAEVTLPATGWAAAGNWLTAHPLRLGLTGTLAALLYLWVAVPSAAYVPARHAQQAQLASIAAPSTAAPQQIPAAVETATTLQASKRNAKLKKRSKRARRYKLSSKRRRALRRHIAKARKALKRHRYRRALRHARRALRIQPRSRVAIRLKKRARRRL